MEMEVEVEMEVEMEVVEIFIKPTRSLLLAKEEK
jgi:hypothetical protein